MTTLAAVVCHLVPESFKRRRLEQLFMLTAAALEVEAPDLDGMSFDQCLHRYAVFTKEHVEAYLQSGHSVEAVKSRLYNSAHALGRELRSDLHIRSWNAAVLALEAIYAMIGIELRYGKAGDITVSGCFFSSYYSDEICSLICSLDEGLAAGLSDGGELRFVERITGGACCCRGTFTRGQ